MRVLCVNDSPSKNTGSTFLVKGNVYEVLADCGAGYRLKGDMLALSFRNIDWTMGWRYNRFISLSDDDCPQCGSKH